MTIRRYIIGFGLSAIFTLTAFWLVTQPVPREWLIGTLIVLAIAQFVVQVVCFLHLGQDKSHWSVIVLAFAIFIVVVLVGGSLWIMGNLEGTHDFSKIFPSGEISPQAQDD